jgi:hypothetical protein
VQCLIAVEVEYGQEQPRKPCFPNKELPVYNGN